MFNPILEWWKNFTAPWFPCRVCGRQVREVYRAGAFHFEDSDGGHLCNGRRGGTEVYRFNALGRT